MKSHWTKEKLKTPQTETAAAIQGPPAAGGPDASPPPAGDAAAHHERLRRLLELGEPPPTEPSSLPRWRVRYVLEIEKRRAEIRAFRVRVLRDGTDGYAMTLIKHVDAAELAGGDPADRQLLLRIVRLSGAGLGRTPRNEYVPCEDRVSAVHFADTLRLLQGRKIGIRRNGTLEDAPAAVREQEADLEFHLRESECGDVLETSCGIGGIPIPLRADLEILTDAPLWVLNGGEVLCIRGVDARAFRFLHDLGWKMTVPSGSRATFRHTTLGELLARFNVRGRALEVRTQARPLSPRLLLDERGGSLTVTLQLMYGDAPVRTDSTAGKIVVPDGDGSSYYAIPRLMEEERTAVARLLETPLARTGQATFSPTCNPLDWVCDHLPSLVERGFQVFGRERLVRNNIRKNPSLRVAFSSGIDWFEAHPEVSFDGVPLPYADLFDAVRSQERFVRLCDGSVGVMPGHLLRKLARAFAVTEAQRSGWRFHRHHVPSIDQVFSESEVADRDGALLQLREKFKAFRSIPRRKIPQRFRGTLRPYQKAGYEWLRFLGEMGFGGCLADDMGLGKTVQALALLSHEYARGSLPPSLIVVPTSIVFNWLHEAGHFSPDLRINVLTRPRDQESGDLWAASDIVLTTYGILRRHPGLFHDRRFHYVILDEAQNIKNPGSKTARIVRTLAADHRLALTGTPVENSLMDLWSQFSFLNPGLLGSAASFRREFVKPIEKMNDEQAAETLRKSIYPFLLRRTKDLVARDLPPKVESVTYCEMEPSQRGVYESVRERYRASILRSIDEIGMDKSRFKVLEGLMKLREICCHPVLIDPQYAGSSGKFEVWKSMLEEILAEGHKVLVFSQFVKMLRVLSSHCDTLGMDYEYLDGSTRDRRDRVERFQKDEGVRAFLISLRAGGTGLNLTSADYVIQYDPWWNPAVEAQAADRAHRIGQRKKVLSYRLITQGSVEEAVMELQQRKKRLSSSVVATDRGLVKTLTRNDIEELFR